MCLPVSDNNDEHEPDALLYITAAFRSKGSAVSLRSLFLRLTSSMAATSVGPASARKTRTSMLSGKTAGMVIASAGGAHGRATKVAAAVPDLCTCSTPV